MKCEAECPNQPTHKLNGKHVCYAHYLPLVQNKSILRKPDREQRITDFILTEFPYGSRIINYEAQQKIRSFLDAEPYAK